MRHLYAAITKATSGGANGEFEAIASMPTLDRDREIIDPGCFSPLPKIVPVHVDHKMDSANLVGSGVPRYEGNALLLRGTFASTAKAQQVREMVLDGHLTTMSVGFMGAKKTEKDGITHITKAELLEVSFVTVPSNREAVVLAAKRARGGGGIEGAKARARAAALLADLALTDDVIALKRHARALVAESGRTLAETNSPRQILNEAQNLLRELGRR